MTKTNYLEDALVNHVLRNIAMSSPATVYMGLHTADPTEVGNVGEVSGGSYARQAVSFGAPSDGAVSNDADVVFPEATANWGTITHFTIWDAVSGGNCLYYGTLDQSKAVDTGIVFRVLTGNLTVTEQ